MLYNLHFVTSSSNYPKMQLMGMSIVLLMKFKDIKLSLSFTLQMTSDMTVSIQTGTHICVL